MTPMQPYKGPRYCRGGKLKKQGTSIPAAARTARTAPQQEYNRKCLMCQACTRHKRNCACHGTDRRSPEALRPPTDGRCIWNSAQRRSKQYKRKCPATYNHTRKPDTHTNTSKVILSKSAHCVKGRPYTHDTRNTFAKVPVDLNIENYVTNTNKTLDTQDEKLYTTE